MLDVVYIVRSDIVGGEELQYSLRSLSNLEHGKVWIAGGCPDNIYPDEILPVKQKGETKWERVAYTLRKVCMCPEISDTFYLFNDDFFILQPTEEIPPIYNGDLKDRIKSLGNSRYNVQLKFTKEVLERRDLGTKNYAVHIPMPIEKEKALEVLDEFNGYPMFRCLYGNYWDIGGEDRPDVKIKTNSGIPAEDDQFVSTSDVTFKWGEIGRYLKRRFPERSEYEVRHGKGIRETVL